jgi:hypothetical protein
VKGRIVNIFLLQVDDLCEGSGDLRLKIDIDAAIDCEEYSIIWF